jgi:NADH-quinone oxidoreductase subunit K
MLFFVTPSIIIFSIGTYGMFLSRKHALIVSISLELLLLAIVTNYMISSIHSDDMIGQLFVILILTIAASESALASAISITYYRLRGGIAIDTINLLKG